MVDRRTLRKGAKSLTTSIAGTLNDVSTRTREAASEAASKAKEKASEKAEERRERRERKRELEEGRDRMRNDKFSRVENEAFIEALNELEPELREKKKKQIKEKERRRLGIADDNRERERRREPARGGLGGGMMDGAPAAPSGFGGSGAPPVGGAGFGGGMMGGAPQLGGVGLDGPRRDRDDEGRELEPRGPAGYPGFFGPR